jgi:hypothetical protein
VTRIRVLAPWLLVMALVFAPPAMADPVLDFVKGTTFDIVEISGLGGGRGLSTVGWAFTVSTPISISALGLFDVDANGFEQTHDIGLWTSGGTLLAFTTVTDANSSPVGSTSSSGNWRFTTIAPLVLAAGEYVIGASFSGTNSTSFGDQFVANATAFTVPGVTFDEPRLGFGPGLSFPVNSTGVLLDGFFGPNLSAVPFAAVAEPASLLLLGTGLAGLTGLAAWRARRRR